MAKKKKVRKAKAKAKKVNRKPRRVKPKAIRRPRVYVAPRKRPQVKPLAVVIKEKRSLLPIVVMLLVVLLIVLLPLGLSERDQEPKMKIQTEEIQINSLEMNDSRKEQLEASKASDEAKAEHHRRHQDLKRGIIHSEAELQEVRGEEESCHHEESCDDEDSDTIQNIQIIQ